MSRANGYERETDMIVGTIEKRIKMSGRELRSLMRKHRVTIRELSRRAQVTQKRIREVRTKGLTGLAVLDWQQAIIGEFTPKLRAIFKQYQQEQDAQWWARTEAKLQDRASN